MKMAYRPLRQPASSNHTCSGRMTAFSSARMSARSITFWSSQHRPAGVSPPRVGPRQGRPGRRPALVHQPGLAEVPVAARPAPHRADGHPQFSGLRLVAPHQRDAWGVLRLRLPRRGQLRRPGPVAGQHLADMPRAPPRHRDRRIVRGAEQHSRRCLRQAPARRAPSASQAPALRLGAAGRPPGPAQPSRAGRRRWPRPLPARLPRTSPRLVTAGSRSRSAPCPSSRAEHHRRGGRF